MLLFGNHDFHYIPEMFERYSGYKSNPIISELIKYVIDEKLVQLSYVYNDMIFTHAGVTNTYFDKLKHADKNDIENSLNDILYSKPTLLKFGYFYNYITYIDPYGDNKFQSPIWVRPYSLESDMLTNTDNIKYKQIVGHTKQDNISFNEDSLVYYIDVLDSVNEYLIIDDNKFNIIKL